MFMKNVSVTLKVFVGVVFLSSLLFGVNPANLVLAQDNTRINFTFNENREFFTSKIREKLEAETEELRERFPGDLYITNLEVYDHWAIASAALLEDGTSYLFNVLFVQKGGDWSVRTDENVSKDSLELIPNSEMSQETKVVLFSQAFPQFELFNEIQGYNNYKFPWPAGERWVTWDDSNDRPYYEYGGWHQDWKGYALDFNPPSYSEHQILASAPGTIVWGCHDNNNQAAIHVQTSGTNELVRYYHLDYSQALVSYGQVSQGDKIGKLAEGVNQPFTGCNLFSDQTHIHLGVPYRPVNIDGRSFTQSQTYMGYGLMSSQDMNENIEFSEVTTQLMEGDSLSLELVNNDLETVVDKVIFLVNGEIMTEDTEAPYLYSVNAVEAGVYDVVARVYDDSGSLLEQEYVSVAVDCDLAYNEFCGKYYNTADFSGDVAVIKREQTINKDWGSLRPNMVLNQDYFSAIWDGSFTFAEDAEYVFRITNDDRARVYIDDEILIDSWDKARNDYQITKYLENGLHNLRVEYVEKTKNAKIKFDWGKIGCPGGDLFTDVDGLDVFYDYICNLKSDGVIDGYSDGEFKDQDLVSRGAMAKFIVNGFGFEEDLSCGDFPDVGKDDTFYFYITTLKCKEVVTGYPNGEFIPNGLVTRGAAMKFVMNAKVKKEVDPSLILDFGDFEGFNDVGENHPFYQYILSGGNLGIVGGYKDGSFRPNEQVTRGAMSKIVDISRQ